MDYQRNNTEQAVAFNGKTILSHRNELLLSVWREACRHIEIVDSLDRIAPLLIEDLPASAILIRQFSPERQLVETVASTVLERTSRLSTETRSECTVGQMNLLMQWVRHAHVHHETADDLGQKVPGLLPQGLTGQVLAGPLMSEHGHLGALIVVGAHHLAFLPQHEQLVHALLEPFTVALENDRRLHELVTFRERAEAENRSLLSKLGRTEGADQVVGEQTGLREVMERVHLVSRADVPVLILGETGSGKEVIARAIHRKSQRANGPFLRVNCGAIPPELLDSELFGHEKGSFTGAAGLRKGWFERADGGTLFLDECGELPPAAQVRLLRVLQDGSFERVGGEKSLTVDVRVVAATHRDLKSMVADKTFREDLWYRLAVFPIHLPSLRERRQDIPEMVRHFAARAAHKLGMRPCVPSDDQIDMLMNYSWPGNVRELASVMERAAILGGGTHLEVAMALGHSATPTLPPPAPLEAENPVQNRTTSIVTQFPSLDDAIATHIESALVHAKGRIEGPHGAARLLGVNPHTLRSRMRKLSIPWQKFRGS